MSTCHNLESPVKTVSVELIVFIRLVYGYVCEGPIWLLIAVGRHSSLWVEPPPGWALNCERVKRAIRV